MLNWSLIYTLVPGGRSVLSAWKFSLSFSRLLRSDMVCCWYWCWVLMGRGAGWVTRSLILVKLFKFLKNSNDLFCRLWLRKLDPNWGVIFGFNVSGLHLLKAVAPGCTTEVYLGTIWWGWCCWEVEVEEEDITLINAFTIASCSPSGVGK